MDRGYEELKALKDTLRGVVELDAGDRLAFDMRVMWRRKRIGDEEVEVKEGVAW